MKKKYWQSICTVVLLSASIGTTALASSSSASSTSNTSSEVSSTTTSSTESSGSKSESTSTSGSTTSETGTNTTDTATSGTSSSDTSSSTSSSSDGEISIPDATLKAAIYKALDLTSTDELTQENLDKLTTLEVSGVSDFTGLDKATKLVTLSIDKSPNVSKDFAVLKSLTDLTSLAITDSDIEDPSFLITMTDLKTLNLDDNKIADISSLNALTTTSISAIDQVLEETTSNKLTDGFQMKYPVISFDGKAPAPTKIAPDTGKFDEESSIIKWATIPTGTTSLDITWESASTKETVAKNFSGTIKIAYSASSSTSSTNSSGSTSSIANVSTPVSTPVGGENLPQAGESSTSVIAMITGLLVGISAVILLKRRKNTTN